MASREGANRINGRLAGGEPHLWMAACPTELGVGQVAPSLARLPRSFPRWSVTAIKLRKSAKICRILHV
ncbi:hypothetical protein, partial [Candidatus Thiosymbion oneisti]|uniref:hypothetical protein n=1 Tax=Candidatus Thiosymbion oneisti TaxID=589554 RepID=UPI001A9C289E